MLGAGVERRPTCVQLPRMMVGMKVLARRDPGDGTPVHWTWPQLARAMGFDVAGLSASQIDKRFTTAVERTLRYLIKAGLVEGWETAFRGREPIGILVTLPAGVAQSVGSSRSPRARGEHTEKAHPVCSPGVRAKDPHAGAVEHPRARPGRLPRRPGSPFFSGQSVEAPIGDVPLSRCFNLDLTHGGGRASAPSTRERAQLSTIVAAALARLRSEGVEGGGAASAPELRLLPYEDYVLVLREAVRSNPEAMAELRDANSTRHEQRRELALSIKSEDQLVRSARQLDRTLGAGSALSLILLLPESRQDRQELLKGASPFSLGGYVLAVRRWARSQAKIVREARRESKVQNRRRRMEARA